MSLRLAPSDQHGWASSSNARRAAVSRFGSFFVIAAAICSKFRISSCAHQERREIPFVLLPVETCRGDNLCRCS